MNYLFVVAHPDDEVLGAGALISKLKREGHSKTVSLVLNSFDSTRYDDGSNELVNDLETSSRIIGIDKHIVSTYADSNFINADHREMVCCIERAIRDNDIDYVFMHSFADNNLDHAVAAQATVEAVRYGQRGRYDAKPVSGVYAMEILSSTNWCINESVGQFRANAFAAVGNEDLERKIAALQCYENVLRPHPFPRSREDIYAQALLRGSQSGYEYAEAFQCVFKREAFT